MNVRSYLFCQIRNFIDKRDLGGQKRVSRIFDELGAAAAGVHDRRLIEIKRSVNLSHDLAPTLVICSHNDAVRMLEIAHRRTLSEEFRVRNHGNIRGSIHLREYSLHLVAGTDRHS